MARRGTQLDTGNRFSSFSSTPFDDGWESFVDDPDPRTTIVEDTSRSAFATNNSPDIPFSHSINPYRGCEHGCAYCLDGDTLILMADGNTKPLRNLVIGEAIIGSVREGWYRRYVRTEVLAHWSSIKESYRILLADGTSLIASGDHRFLTERGWKFVAGSEYSNVKRPHLTLNNRLMGMGCFSPSYDETITYREGYLSGMIHGDGHIGFYKYERDYKPNDRQLRFRPALVDVEGLQRTQAFLLRSGIKTDNFIHQHSSATTKEVRAIRTSIGAGVEAISRLIEYPANPPSEWYRGFLAGIFDAEGGYNDGALRFFNTDESILATIENALDHFKFLWVRDAPNRSGKKIRWSIRLRGGLSEHLRFFHTVNPAIRRKCSILGTAVKSNADLEILEIEKLSGKRELFDITTGTGDFVANGVISHNCYARPTHEYLGFNAGIDFESIIVVKRNAAELARRAMMKPSWKPTSVSMSGVTDPYQPLEKKLRITRSILEVMLEFRNPVGIITKNALVCRDLDLLTELARQNCVAVFLSVTTLDRDLARRMEPRTSTPDLRLRAIERLASAGVPVGAMVAPIIPGLNEGEIPSILSSVADAGARWAGHVILKLPLAVKPIFLDWLDREEPGRSTKVRHNLEEMKGKTLNRSEFGLRMKGEGPRAETIKQLFSITAKRLGLNVDPWPVTTKNFQRPGIGAQMGLFDE